MLRGCECFPRVEVRTKCCDNVSNCWLATNKKQLKIVMSSQREELKSIVQARGSEKYFEKNCLKCKFWINKQFVQSISSGIFFHFANYLNTIFRSLSSMTLANIRSALVIQFTSQSSQLICRHLCLLTWKVLLTFHFWRLPFRNPTAHL